MNSSPETLMLKPLINKKKLRFLCLPEQRSRVSLFGQPNQSRKKFLSLFFLIELKQKQIRNKYQKYFYPLFFTRNQREFVFSFFSVFSQQNSEPKLYLIVCSSREKQTEYIRKVHSSQFLRTNPRMKNKKNKRYSFCNEFQVP